MKMERLGSILGVALLSMSTASYAEQAAGDREATLSGSGFSSGGFDTTTFSVDGQYGWFQSKALEFGVRQTVGIADNGDNTLLRGATRVFADYHFDLREWQPFIGASLGGQYGAGIDEAFIIGPEIGVKYYVKPKTFILGQVSYQFDVDEDVDDGSTFYTLGIGFNF